MELGEFNADVGYREKDSYIWEVPGKLASIEIDFDVVDRLSDEIRRGSQSPSRRGVEVGGILLGSMGAGDKLEARILDFEPVPCTYLSGPAYRIEEGDRVRLEEALRRWRPEQGRRLQAIGFYRAHTREGLLLDRHDRDIIGRYFPGDTGIILLVKPYTTRPAKAGFFFKERGVIRSDLSPREFPFRREELGGGRTARAEVEDAVNLNTTTSQPGGSEQFFDPNQVDPAGLPTSPAPPRPAAPDPYQSSVPKRTLRLRGGWVWIPLSFVFLLVGTILGFQVALSVRGKVHTGPMQDPYALNLSATPSADSIHLRWDRLSPAIVQAKRGTLTITEHGVKKEVSLDAGHLRNGSVIYRRASNDVTFRLEVFLKDNVSVSETVAFRPVTPTPPDSGG